MKLHETKVVFAATSAHMLNHAYMMIFPSVLVLIAKDPALKATGYFQLGAIGTLCFAMFGIGAIPAGMLSDRYGPKRILTICVFASAMAALSVWMIPSIYGLVASMTLLGAGASLYHPSGLSFISRNVEQKGKAMGYHGVGGNLGLALGPVLSGAAAAIWGWRSAFVVFGILGLALGVVILKLGVTDQANPGKTEAGAGGGVTESFAPIILFLVYSTSVLYGLCYKGSLMYFPKHFADNIGFAANDVAMAGLLVAMVNISGTVGQVLGGALCDRVRRPEYAYILIFVFTTLLFFLIWLLTDWWLFLASMVFAPFFFSWQPIQNTLIARYASRKAQGLSFGVSFLLIMGVGSLAAFVGGYVTDVAGVAEVFAVLGGISGLALVLVLAVLKRLHARRDVLMT